MDLGQPLLVPVLDVFRHVHQMLVQLLERLGVIPAQIDPFPEILGAVGAFHGFYVEGDPALRFSHHGVGGVGQRAVRSVAKARYGVRVLAEVAAVPFVRVFGGSDGGLEGAELVVDHLPYHFIVLHYQLLFVSESCKGLLLIN